MLILKHCTKQLRLILPHLCVSQGDRGFDGLPGLPGDKGHRVSPGEAVTCGFSQLSVVICSSFLESYFKFHFMCSRVTQGHWDLQDLKERMENGYKASADPDFKVIPSRFE